MFQLFANRNPVILAVLLIFVIILRLPTFDINFLGNVESSQMIAAERILNGGLLYQDVWDNKPPLTVWFYTFFQWVFGSFALRAINIFAIIYVFVSALLIDRLISNFRPPNESSSLPAFLYVLLICSPWYSQEVGPEFLSTLPMLSAISLLSLYSIEEQKNWIYLFWVGFLIGICLGLKVQGLVFLLTIVASYALVTRPLIREMVTGLTGLITAIIFIFLPVYINGCFGQFWDLAIIYNYDNYKYDIFNGKITDVYSLLDFARVFGIFALITLFGFLSYRGRRSGWVIKHRKFEVFMSVILISGAAIVAVSGKFFFLPYVYFALPAMVYYISGYLHIRSFRWLKNIIITAAYFTPIYAIVLYVFCSNSQLFKLVEPFEQHDYWIRQFKQSLHTNKQFELLKKDISRHKIRNGIWIASYQPDLYLRLNQKCASKYVDFAVAYNKMDWLSHNFKHSSLLSQSEDLAKVHEAFRTEMPDYIIDPYGIFHEIKNHLPILLNDYSVKKVGYYKVYYLRKTSNATTQVD